MGSAVQKVCNLRVLTDPACLQCCSIATVTVQRLQEGDVTQMRVYHWGGRMGLVAAAV